MSGWQDALHAAERAFRALESEIRTEKRLAEAKVQERYSERQSAAYKVRSDANNALNAHIEATTTHPWNGKRVWRMVSGGRRAWDHRPQVREDGICEIVTRSSRFSDNLRNRPAIGLVIVRKMKKDGTASLQIADDSAWGMQAFEARWTLADEQGESA